MSLKVIDLIDSNTLSPPTVGIEQEELRNFSYSGQDQVVLDQTIMTFGIVFLAVKGVILTVGTLANIVAIAYTLIKLNISPHLTKFLLLDQGFAAFYCSVMLVGYCLIAFGKISK